MGSGSDPARPVPAGLAGIQRWFAGEVLPTRIPAGASSSAAPAPQDVLLPSATLQAEERLAIYRDMVARRLLDSLAEDYPWPTRWA